MRSKMAHRVYLSPSDQIRNLYAYGDTNEAVQCGRIAAYCKTALERSGVEVMVGQYDTMAARCAAADRFGAQLYVPIHTNAAGGKAGGTRIFYYDKASKGYIAAQKILAVLGPLTPGEPDQVSAYPGLYEVRTPQAPTAYVEIEFHDVLECARWIIDHVEPIGEAIARGICDYFGVKYVAAGQKDEPGTVYRVQIGAFLERANAESALAKARAAGFPDAFIVEGKK